MKKRNIRTVSLILCVIMTLSLFTALAFADSTAESMSEETTYALSDEMQLKENEANEKYNALLREWAFDPQYISDTHADFPGFYGGAYIDHEKNLVIQVTSLDDSVIAYFASIIDLDDVVFEEVKYSFIELVTEQEAILGRLLSGSKSRAVENISEVGISCRTNSIEVYIVSPSEDSIAAHSTDDIKTQISDFENIEIITSGGYYEPCALLEPGSEILANNRSRFSVGFWARDDNDNVGIVTAAHDKIVKGSTITVGDRTFGKAETVKFAAEVDAAFIKRTNSYFTPMNYVSGWDFELKSNSYELLAEGSTAYCKGYASGCQMGEVTKTSSAIIYWKDESHTTGIMLRDCGRISATSVEGDSGGIVAGGGTSSSRYAVGIIPGSNNFEETVYIKAGNIIRDLGVYVY